MVENTSTSAVSTSPEESLWAVVLVHGVGETTPGNTLEALLPSVLEQKKANLGKLEPPEVRMLREWKEPPKSDIDPKELEPPGPDPPVALKERFPMHLRRFEIKNSPPAAPNAPKKAVFAEVYWADIASAKGGRFDFLIRLFTVIFHLRFLADRATALDAPGARWLRFFVFVTCWVLCGPIVALHAFLFYLLLAHYPFQTFAALRGHTWDVACWEIILAILGLLAIVLGYSMVRLIEFKKWGPWRVVFWWISAYGAILTIIASLGTRPGTWSSGFLDWALTWGSAPTGRPFFDYLTVFLRLLDHWFCLLALGIVLCLGIWLVLFVDYSYRKKIKERNSITVGLAAMLAQVVLWVILAPALAVLTLSELYPEWLNSYDSPFSRNLGRFTLNLSLASLIALTALMVWVFRRLWVSWHPDASGGPTASNRVPRLLVNSVILGTLILVSAAGVTLFLRGYIFGRWEVHNFLSRPYAEKLATWTVVVLPLAWLFLGKGLRAGLHIVTDVVNHFYERRLKVPWPWCKPRKVEIENFRFQMQIEGRMRRVLQEVLTLGNVTDLTIVSHSQGTVIAIDVLWFKWASELLNGKKVRLVTMGSPFTHLYQHYFSSRYPDLFINGTLNSEWGTTLDKTVKEWLNIYRFDDFVGTWIAGKNSYPDNKSLGPGGHMNYWNQPQVVALLVPYLPG